ncbi:hypothetical protein AB0057_26675, partial [Klebsiella pneumoniae]
MDETQLRVVQRHDSYLARMNKQYNKKVVPRPFQVGELVLRIDNLIDKRAGEGCKFRPNWIGPYMVK